LEIESFKLRLRDTHVRVLPRSVQGQRFSGPGIDLLGSDATSVFEAAEGFVQWAKARDSTCDVRSVSVQMAPQRITISLADVHGTAHGKPQVIRIDPPESSELMDVALKLLPLLARLAGATLSRRAAIP
jgi:hypothetical protein